MVPVPPMAAASVPTTPLNERYRLSEAASLAEVERERLARIALEHRSATAIQATFRMFAGRMEYIDRRVREVASVQVQRMWRGRHSRQVNPQHHHHPRPPRQRLS